MRMDPNIVKKPSEVTGMKESVTKNYLEYQINFGQSHQITYEMFVLS